ncbi:MAG TPA: ABC transporter ATP-binding protein [Urbifossiella sp.]|nr:ABC transporter ATP-binding protein [Urbifossiella sp.]
MPVFETRSLCKVYGGSPPVRAVNEVSLSMERGSVVAITGPSGSGKTTLLAMLGALERPTSGSVMFAGIDLTTCSSAELARVRRRLGFVFQDFALIPGLSAWENVAYPLIPRGTARRERFRIATQWLVRFGLAAKSATRAKRLSGGEQQRVAIARAFAGRPEALLADEPTSNLDADTADLFLAALVEFRSAGGAAAIASHDPRLVEAASERREMKAGNLV